MNKIITTDICVIGAGSGGLSVAAGAVQMGAKVVLIEKGKMGGDCLNTGCVPSKALLAAGHAAENARRASRFGVSTGPVEIDFGRAIDHVHSVIAGIAPHDSVERFEELGCTVIQAEAHFTGPDEVVAGDTTIKAKRFVIATGSRAAVPPIPGLETVCYFTNETIFENRVRPEHLIIIGGGPIGLEMAQAHHQLGAKVTVIEMGSILPKDDPDLVAVVRDRIKADGISLYEGAKTKEIRDVNDQIRIVIEHQGIEITLEGSHLLLATGRKPNVENLGLKDAGIDYTDRGISVDARLRTSNKKVFAIGDITGGLQFTHMAGYDAGIVIRNALFRLPAKVDHSAVPWVTYTNPELAQVGLTEKAAREQHGDDIRVVTWDYAENDRARAEAETEGFIKVVTKPNGRILGAAIVGRQAGELIGVWSLAISKKMKIGAIAGMIAPYPTLGELSKRVAGAWYTPSLFGEKTRKLVRFLLRFA
ncbi:MAG: FAD-dependent oxidoreductase [Thalassospira sp.]|uniref:dihydrolipoyl dehydrogenase family protein n=1 Tax=Thalassospira sp. TaxID=1912094 RepID=UPI001B01AD42|nr:FAD-dependent oxidoreductase [Thalassospira sp.]MBO6580765.1 FAD-dependent oxidoreductase [Thalassospira sp.]MBO6801764.1 FAD-dependent oxidoreductase [Thalassospira sp.]MBO6820492.1 FAD-dependent oxidoreductase [Thalassospira sp.]MBO6887658.1 FAD-dependent oxidoreductase [Thalassospira sp.]